MSNLELLQQSELFTGLPSDFVNRFVDVAEQVSIPPGEPVIGELSEQEKIYMICEGECTMRIMLSSPDEFAEFVTLKPGDFVGQLSVFGSSIPPGTCLAESEMVLWKWDANDWRKICEADPATGYHLIFRVGKVVVQRLRMWGMKAIDSISWGIGM